MIKSVPRDLVWLGVPVTVKGEDFSYEAICLCSFPKINGTIRYIVEDRGRLFIQRKEQLTFGNSDEPFTGTIIIPPSGPTPEGRSKHASSSEIAWGGIMKANGVNRPPGLLNKRITVWYRDGREFDTIYPSGEGLDWSHNGGPNDIMYFKVAKYDHRGVAVTKAKE